jgi:hypothetical protein
VKTRVMAAAAINKDTDKVRRLELLNKIDIEVNINDALLLANEEGLLTALDDRYLVSIISYSFNEMYHI